MLENEFLGFHNGLCSNDGRLVLKYLEKCFSFDVWKDDLNWTRWRIKISPYTGIKFSQLASGSSMLFRKVGTNTFSLRGAKLEDNKGIVQGLVLRAVLNTQ